MSRALLVALGVALLGCGGKPEPKAPEAAACLVKGIEEMLIAKSCQEALGALQRVVRAYPECAEALTPKGSELAAVTLGAVTLVCDWPAPAP